MRLSLLALRRYVCVSFHGFSWCYRRESAACGLRERGEGRGGRVPFAQEKFNERTQAAGHRPATLHCCQLQRSEFQSIQTTVIFVALAKFQTSSRSGQVFFQVCVLSLLLFRVNWIRLEKCRKDMYVCKCTYVCKYTYLYIC